MAFSVRSERGLILHLVGGLFGVGLGFKGLRMRVEVSLSRVLVPHFFSLLSFDRDEIRAVIAGTWFTEPSLLLTGPRHCQIGSLRRVVWCFPPSDANVQELAALLDVPVVR